MTAFINREMAINNGDKDHYDDNDDHDAVDDDNYNDDDDNYSYQHGVEESNCTSSDCPKEVENREYITESDNFFEHESFAYNYLTGTYQSLRQNIYPSK